MDADPKRIRPFASPAAFNTWLRTHHATEEELWLRMYKKGSGVASVTWQEAVEVALCWGWIDGLRKSYDKESFLQRYTPRRPKSVWSEINTNTVTRLLKEGRMQPAGLKQVELAKADGRWAAAYRPIRASTAEDLPADLLTAINASPRAKKLLAQLNKANLFALNYRTNNMKTPEGRAKKIRELVAMLARGETIIPLPKKKPPRV